MPIPLREDFDAAQLRLLARRAKDAAQARRLLALAAIYDGATRAEAAAIGSVTRQIVRDWVVKFNANGPVGLIDRKPQGRQRPRSLAPHRDWILGRLERKKDLMMHALAKDLAARGIVTSEVPVWRLVP